MAEPGGGGDLHITRIDGSTYDFGGGGHQRYRLIEADGIGVAVRLTEVPGDPPGSGRTYCEGVDIRAGDSCQVYISTDGVINVWVDGRWMVQAVLKIDTIDAPGHPGSTSDDPHPLTSVPHINITVPRYPDDPGNASGLIVDGDDQADPARYCADATDAT